MKPNLIAGRRILFGATALCSGLTASAAMAQAPSGVGQSQAQTQTPPPPPVETATGEAQPGAPLQDIVVTARRREESVQRVPVTINVVTSQQLTTLGIRNISDLSRAVPGLTYQQGGDAGAINFGIRGQSFTNGTTFPAVVPYFAEVPLMRVTDGQLFDLQNVQVLKGPQGTLFGRVTDGGAILLSPVKPGNELDGFAQLQLGNYNLHQFDGAVTLPILEDRVSFRIAGNITRRDGYTKNLFDGRDLDNLHSESVRASLVIKPTDNIENYTIVNYSHASTNGLGTILTGVNPLDLPAVPGAPWDACCSASALQAALALQNALGPRKTVQGADDPFLGNRHGNFIKRQSLWIVNTTSWNIAKALVLKNIFGYQRADDPNSSDLGGTSAIGYTLGTFEPGAAGHREQITDEVQAVGSILNDRVEYIAGGYFEWANPVGLNEQIAYLYDGDLLSSSSSYTRTRSTAGYAQVGVKIIDGLKLNAGIRRTHDSNTTSVVQYLESAVPALGLIPQLDDIPHGQCRTSGSGLPINVLLRTPCTAFSTSSSVTTYTLGLDYQITRSLFAYASLRKGYRPGGVNTSISNSLPVPGYGPETDLSKEVGLKATYGTGAVRMRTNVSAFYDIFKQIQRSQVIAPGDGQAPYAAIFNAPRATIKGIELEQTIELFHALTLTANWAYLDAKYDVKSFNYTPAVLAAACPADVETTAPDPTHFCPLTPFPLAPKNTVTASIDYKIPLHSSVGEVHVGGNLYYTAKNFELGTDIAAGTVPAYTVYNANVTWDNVMGRSFDITLFVNNLTNKTYISTIASNYMDAGSGGFGFSAVYYAPPRMFGASLKYRFGTGAAR